MRNNEILKLYLELETAYRNYNLAEVARLQGKINAMQHTTVTQPMKGLLDDISDENRSKILNAMHKMFILSDLLYGAAMELEEQVKRTDSTIMRVHIAQKAKAAAADCRSITREIDDLNDEYLSDTCRKHGRRGRPDCNKRDQQIPEQTMEKAKSKGKEVSNSHRDSQPLFL